MTQPASRRGPRPPRLLKVIASPLSRFLRMEATGGILLIAATLLTLLWANSPFAGSYHALWETPINLRIGSFVLEHPLHHWVNDALMAIFFFMVGLEVKREMVAGDLSTPRTATMPMLAALGGMIVPALIYYAIAHEGAGARGWGVPMATDIAFSLGILTLLGKRVPLSLKIFLTAFAIVDDIGGVLVIVLFYSGGLNVDYLLISAGLLAFLLILNVYRVRFIPMYVVVGIGVWLLFLRSGIHPTIAGVLVAFTLPANPKLRPARFLAAVNDALTQFRKAEKTASDCTLSKGELAATDEMARAIVGLQSPVQRMEQALHGWVAFFILPVFALANAGVPIVQMGLADALDPIALGITLGLLLGKTIGIFSFTWLALKFRLGDLPGTMTLGHLLGASVLGGVGFTVSLFVAALAFPDPHVLDVAKLGILMGSAVSGILGLLVTRMVLRAPLSPAGGDSKVTMKVRRSKG